MGKQGRAQMAWWCRLGLVVVLLFSAVGAAPPPPEKSPVTKLTSLVAAALSPGWSVETVEVSGETVTVCLSGSVDELRAGEGLGAEWLESAVAQSLTPFSWQVLHVQARDPQSRECRGLSSFLPAVTVAVNGTEAAVAPAPAVRSGQGALAGKTVYLSAGHGWQWNGAAWRTQRPVYQGFIEDHNNAEVVNQYLVPYLEQAGATVVPVRERDRNVGRVVLDNDAGASGYQEEGLWNGSTAGYAGGSYRYALTVAGAATARARWQLTVPEKSVYALYVWNVPASNRAVDARYTFEYAGGTAVIYLDQSHGPTTWRYLGSFPFYAGPMTVTLDNGTATAGQVVVADALRLGGGSFDSLTGIDVSATNPPNRPWWESGTYYYSQWVGLNPADWPYYNDIVARPMFARWNYRAWGGDAVFISWHTNGYNGTVRGTESYVHDGTTYARTPGSVELQTAVHDELIHDIRAGWDAGWTDRGKKQRDLGEVRMLWDSTASARMPGVLLEIAYHDSVEDAAALKDARFEQLSARAVYQGIVAYYESRDGVDLTLLPEPPTKLRVENRGQGSVRVSWAAPAVDSVGLGGDAATEYRVYASPDGFAWGTPTVVTGTEGWLTGLTPGQTRYVKVTAANAGGESFPTEVLGARVGDQPALLIVNGFDKLVPASLWQESDPTEGVNGRMWLERMNRRDYILSHGDAVPAGMAWDSASNEAVSSGVVDLQHYGVVDWILGEESSTDDGTLNQAERGALADYLNAGKALLISGAELAWDLVAIGRDPAFLQEGLHADYVTDDAATYTAQPASGGILDGVGAVRFDAPGEYDVDYPDGLSPRAGAVSVLTYSTGSSAAVAYSAPGGCPRSLLYGFPLEMIRTDVRSAVIQRSLTYLSACAATLEPDTGIAAPQAGAVYSSTPVVTGWGWGEGLRRVELQVYGAFSGTFWSGSDWAVQPVWITTTGTVSWTYGLPALTDGVYTLTARAVATQTDSTPAEMAFTVDTLPPAAPVPVTPTGGVSVTLLNVPLQWAAVSDPAGVVFYQVQVDGVTGTWGLSNVVTVPLSVGEHRWQVRAMDAVGNVGGWSDEVVFTAAPRLLYLPLVYRNYAGEVSGCTMDWTDGFEAEGGWDYNGQSERNGELVHAGSWAGRIGLVPGSAAPGGTVYASVSRVITLPAGVRSITLHYWRATAPGSDPTDRHYVSVKDAAGATTTLAVTALGSGSGWVTGTVHLTQWAGTAVRIYLGTINNVTLPTSALYLDDVELEVCR